MIVGQVVDAGSGSPVSGAVVTMGGPARSGRRTLTGGDGRFVWRDLQSGTYTINAGKWGYVPGSVGRRRPDGPAQPVVLGEGSRLGDVVIRLWKHAAISGVVLDEAGEPLIGVQVRAFRRRVVSGRLRFVTGAVAATDDRGMYRAANLTPGDYVVASSARDVAVPLSVAQDMQVVTYPPNAELGAVALPGSTTSIQLGAFVYGLGRGAAIPPPPLDGRLFLYPTTFYPSALVLSQAAVIALGSGEERDAVDLQIRPVPTARVSGTASGPDGPSIGLVVQLVPAAAADVALAPDAPATVTDRNGRFGFSAVPPGQYLMRASVPSHAVPGSTDRDRMLWGELPLTVGSADVHGLTLVLQEGLHISGSVDWEGAPPPPRSASAAPQQVLIEPADAMPGLTIPVTPVPVSPNGRFTSSALPPGKYFVRVAAAPLGRVFKGATYNSRDVADSPLELDSGDAEGVVVTFTDRPTGLRGVVTSRRGPPDPDAIVLAFPTDALAWTNNGINGRRVQSARTSTTGQYFVPSLPPGEYYVAAIADEEAVDWQDAEFLQALTSVAIRVRIVEGQQRTHDLRTRQIR
jgi:hypothetical protein